MQPEHSLKRQAWAAVRSMLIGAGFSEALLRLGLLGLEETRRRLAQRHLPAGGHGLEIGALHCPLALPPGAKAHYLDRHAAQTLRELRANVGGSIIQPDILADGFDLCCIASATQDFVIANHVLEHAPDALGTLENWLRVLRPAGILFITVPIGARCFDRGRPVSPPQHFIEDRQLTAAGNVSEMLRRNRVHVEEHLTVSAPALAREQGRPWVPPKGDAREQEIERLLGRDSSQIHHHVFSANSFASLLRLLGKDAHVERISRSSVELVGIVRKST